MNHFDQNFWYKACDLIDRARDDIFNVIHVEIPGLKSACRLYP